MRSLTLKGQRVEVQLGCTILNMMTLNVLRAGVDPDKYANADRVEDLDLNDFESTDSYFECPLLPARGKNT